MKKLGEYQQYWREKGYMKCCAAPGEAYQPTTLEQLFNCFTHGVSILPAVKATYDMVKYSNSQLHYNVALLYGTSLIMLFSISTTFHVIALVPSYRKSLLLQVFHLGDRFMIYIFISSSYMPWLLLQNFDDYGFNVAYIIWTCALSGILYAFIFHERFKMLETILYLCLGFLPAAALACKSFKGLSELALGGALYVIGIFFFKSDGRVPFAHAIWHVIGSSGTWTHHYAIWNHFYLETNGNHQRHEYCIALWLFIALVLGMKAVTFCRGNGKR